MGCCSTIPVKWVRGTEFLAKALEEVVQGVMQVTTYLSVFVVKAEPSL